MIRRARLLVALGCAVVALVPLRAQQARFRSSADAVQVDVQVRSGGRPVAGLTADDFELRDSGVTQQIVALAFQDVPISLLLALDVSGSLQGEPLAHLKAAARAAIGALRPGDQAALLTFGDRLALAPRWSSDRGALDAAVSGLSANGGTPLHDAIFTAMALRQSAAGRTVLLVFTDGADTISWLNPAAALRAALQSDLVVTAVSTAEPFTVTSAVEARSAFGWQATLRRWFDEEPALFPYAFLERLTEETGGELLHTRSGRDLSRVFEQIVADFKSRYLLTYSPAGVAPSGWHPIEVRLKRRSGEVRARTGYWR